MKDCSLGEIQFGILLQGRCELLSVNEHPVALLHKSGVRRQLEIDRTIPAKRVKTLVVGVILSRALFAT